MVYGVQFRFYPYRIFDNPAKALLLVILNSFLPNIIFRVETEEVMKETFDKIPGSFRKMKAKEVRLRMFQS